MDANKKRKRLFTLRSGRIFWVVVGAAMIWASAAQAASVYIGLGDSITFGETDLRYIQSNGDRGYVSDFADILNARNGPAPRPTVINLAIDGETAKSFLDGTGRTPPVIGRGDTLLALQNSNYSSDPSTPQATKLATMIAQQRAAGNTIDNISITLGFNELAALAVLPTADALAQLPATLNAYRANYTTVLTQIRALAPEANLYLLGYFNPFPGDPTVNTADVLFAQGGPQLNAIIQQLAKNFNGNYVDTATPFVGREAELTYISQFPAGSIVPQPHPYDSGIAPIGNVHPNDVGYAVIAAQVAAIPEPASLSLVGLGMLAIGVIRSRRNSA